MPEFQTFKDFSLTFKSHPITNDLLVVKDENAIKQAIRSLLLTNRGERLFNSELGTNLNRILFEPLDFASAATIREEIVRVLFKYEPRIEIVNLDVTPNEADDGYDVELLYEIVGRDDSPIQVDFFLDRT